MARHYLFTSESVTEGHPDKVCDQVSDAVLDAILEQDPMGRVACETTACTGLLHVMGEITTSCYVDIPKIAREVVREIGYDRGKYGFDCDTCAVITSIDEQSPDIAMGVDESLENKTGEDAEMSHGAGDQGMMFGYACDETPELMPLPLSLAQKICLKMAQVRKSGEIPYMRPDGKSQVTVEYDENDRPIRVDTVVISTQHDPDTTLEQIRADMIEKVAKAVIPAAMLDENTKYYVNPTGRFVKGGPAADSGLTGRKIIVDTYGGSAPHGQVQLAYAIGVAQPVSVLVDTFGTGTVGDDKLEAAVRKVFDLRPTAIIRDLDLRKPIYRKLAAYGHMGREDLGVTWERTDRTEALKAAVAE